MGPALLERERELGRIEDTLGAAGGGSGRVLVFAGPAGIGKTTLLAELTARARQRGADVLFARGGELERDFAFGVVRQLFEPRLAACGEDERATLLAGAAGSAPGALGAPSPVAAPAADQAFGILHGLYWLAAGLAERRTLVIAIDDLDWCDGESHRWLLYLARRIDELSILLAVTTAAGDAGPLADLPHAEMLTPAPLSEDAVGKLLATAIGIAPDAAFARACLAATGGNPYLVGELVRSLPRSWSRAPSTSRPRRPAGAGSSWCSRRTGSTTRSSST